MKTQFRSSLRLRFALSVALPMLVALSGLLVLGYFRELATIRHEMETRARQIGDLAVLGLRRAMAGHGRDTLAQVVRDVVRVPEIMRARVVDLDAVVRLDSAGEMTGTKLDREDPACARCHTIPEAARPRVLAVAAAGGAYVVATPIDNEPECMGCHEQTDDHIGVMLLDLTAADDVRQAGQTALLQLGVSISLTAAVAMFVYWRANRLVTHRVEALEAPLAKFAAGQRDIRLPLSVHRDELDRLAHTFNRLTAELERHAEADRKRGDLLQKTIIEERDRIARELHDSIPQLLAYMTAKIGAVQLLLESGHLEEANDNLNQLSAASSQAFSDVRETIIGLRMSRRIADGLARAIEGYIQLFMQFCQILYNLTGRAALESATYEDLWRFAVANYNAGPGCVNGALRTTLLHGEPLTWERVAYRFEPGCGGVAGYVDFVAQSYAAESAGDEADTIDISTPPIPPPAGDPPPSGEGGVVVAEAFESANVHGNYTAGTSNCAACHRLHTAQQPELTASSLNGNAFCYSCHDGTGATLKMVSTHSNLDRAGVEEPFELQCIQCHEPHGSSNLSAVRLAVLLRLDLDPRLSTGPVIFTARTGLNSFDDGESSPVNRLCLACHVNTDNPGYPMTNHAGGADHDGGVDYSGQDCTACHKHSADGDIWTRDGFMP